MLKIRNIMALTLAVITLTSSSTFAVGLHFCGDHLNNISFSLTPEPCDMQEDIPPCHRQMKSSCCKDQTIQHDGNEFSVHTLNHEISFDSEAILPKWNFLYEIETTFNRSSDFNFSDFQPPLPAIDRNIQFRMLLI